MNDITRKKHTGEPGNKGEFGSKANSAPEAAMGQADNPWLNEDGTARSFEELVEIHKLSPTQQHVLHQEMRMAEVNDHPSLFSGHENRTALSLERKGLGHVRYQGPTMGWYTSSPRETTGRTPGADLRQHGKNLAAEFLASQKHTVIANSKNADENIITDDGGTLVATIVHTRTGTAFGHPLDRVSTDSIGWARDGATAWAVENGREGAKVRIDAIGVIAPRNGDPAHIEHLKGIS